MHKEFLLTNGLGGYCSSSVYHGNTRKYHGLLVIPNNDLDRFVCVSSLQEVIIDGDQTYEISVNQYAPNVEHPQGNSFIQSFHHSPFPTWKYELPNGIKVIKTLSMLHAKNATNVTYEFETNRPIRFEIRPLVTHRNVYNIGNIPQISQKYNPHTSCVVYSIENKEKFRIQTNNTNYIEKPQYYDNFHYPIDHISGDFGTEKLWNSGYFTYNISPIQKDVHLCLSDEHIGNTKDLCIPEHQVQKDPHLNSSHSLYSLYEKLLRASNDFVIHHENQTKVIAGYPFFKDWGRDSMIAFKGCFLIPHRFTEAKDILLAFAKKESLGMIPNRITGIEDYHTIDASLWYVIACLQYVWATHDQHFIEQIYPTLKNILVSYETGTRFGIHMDPTDAMITWTNTNEHLTWMDAQVNGKPVIDRSGKAVEIQALWYNALLCGKELAENLQDFEYAKKWENYAKKLKQNLISIFWNKDHQCLFDSVKPSQKNPSIRPNQLYTLSLPFSCIEKKYALFILHTCKKFLLTPVGMKTLSSNNKDFISEYSGHFTKRDAAYHQGTIWPFLLGTYFLGFLKTHNFSPSAIEETVDYYLKFEQTLENQCIGQISEIHDPTTLEDRGCFAQAWSVAQNLEVVWEILNKDTKKSSK